MTDIQAPDPLEAAMRDGAARALRKRAGALREQATLGTSPAGEKYPGVMIASPEAASATALADDFDDIASLLEAGLS